MRPIHSSTALAVALVGGLMFPAQAGEPDFISPPVYESPATDDQWEFSFAPYLWMSGLDGDIGVGDLVADVDESFDDILENLDMALMIVAEAKKGRLLFQLDGFWISMSADEKTPGSAFDKGKVEIDEYNFKPMIGYRVIEGPTSVDLYAGAQYFRIETDIKFSGGKGGNFKSSGSKDWIDPMIAIRVNHEFSEKWVGVVRGDYGGFGVSSDSVWQAFGAIGYRWAPTKTVFLGYRHFHDDYQSGGVTYDAAMSGFVLGARWQF